MQFDAWLNKAWDDHATQAAAVATWVGGEGLALARTDAHTAALARLAHHVFGEHLGRWVEGRQLLFRLSTSEPAAHATASAVRIFDASLALAGGLEDLRVAMGPSEHIRVSAYAAASLAERDASRAASLLREAALAFDTESLPETDLACRAIAINGNNIASTLCEKALLSNAERDLMVLAARTARDCWSRAGTWLELERAEYRLAISWQKAGDLTAARRHARKCLDLVRENEAPALEWFFGWEATAVAERASGNASAAARAVQEMRIAFARLEDADRGWCKPTLDRMARLAPMANGA